MYELVAHNKAGVSVAPVQPMVSRVDIVRWLTGYFDPQNIAVAVFDDTGSQVGVKPMGARMITWKGRN